MRAIKMKLLIWIFKINNVLVSINSQDTLLLTNEPHINVISMNLYFPFFLDALEPFCKSGNRNPEDRSHLKKAQKVGVIDTNTKLCVPDIFKSGQLETR